MNSYLNLTACDGVGANNNTTNSTDSGGRIDVSVLAASGGVPSPTPMTQSTDDRCTVAAQTRRPRGGGSAKSSKQRVHRLDTMYNSSTAEKIGGSSLSRQTQMASLRKWVLQIERQMQLVQKQDNVKSTGVPDTAGAAVSDDNNLMSRLWGASDTAAPSLVQSTRSREASAATPSFEKVLELLGKRVEESEDKV